tara:strand:+ start:62 stop:655 length:594 start_codon:yes stop_codon:yes gene_type:complete
MLREIPGVLTKEECNLLIEYGKPLLERCKVIDIDSEGGQEIDKQRTSSQVSLSDITDKSLIDLTNKIKMIFSEICGYPIQNQETLTLLNYKIGQEYKPHWDFFSEDTRYFKDQQKYGGQRKISFLVYLNDVEEGGETTYPHLNVDIKPEVGKVLMHHNHHSGKTLESSLHGSKPVIKGEKWVLVCWVRENEWRSRTK